VTSFALVSQDPGEPPAVKAPAIVAGDDPQPFLPTFSGSVNSLTPLQEAASGNGAMNVAVSTDGVVRKVQLLLSHDGTVYPSLTAEALRVALGGSNYMIKSSGASGEGRFGGKTGLVSVRIGDRVIYTDPNGGVLLHYTEPTDQRHIPAWQVLAGEVEPGALEGAIVFVGTTAAGLKDLRLDPLGNAVAGADIHAQAVEQILLDNYLTRPDWAKAVEVLLILILWALLVTAILRLGALWSALIGTIAVALAFLASWYAFTAHRLLLDPVVPAAGALAVFLVCSVSRHFETERKGKWVKDAFSSYISPNLVDYLIDNPDELDLVGVRRECSFVMTDLASFTSMVEKADPELIVSILNEYIEEMVKISLASGGTLDRIVGDAVAVMFSAPIRQEDHAERAVACALAMDEYSVAFRKRKAEEGLTVGKTRIGVHTGTVTIGNIGGETFFDYRALGDPVNTAARLETVNGQLGTRVCVSGFTVEQCSNFVGRSVGRLVLKGKSEGIPAFEPLPDEIASSQRVALYNAAFQLMKDESPEALAAFEALADTYPDDPLAKLHLERLQDGQVGDLLVFKKK
jgi:adenylate cyclase